MEENWLPYLPYDAVCCRYNEIGTKGRNRQFFVGHLVEGLERRLMQWFGHPRFSVLHGRIYMLPQEKGSVITQEQLQALREQIPGLPGVSSLSPGFLVEATVDAIREKILETFPVIYNNYIAAVPEGERTYSMRVNRVDKSFPLRSEELERQMAMEILPRFSGLKIDLRHGGLRVEVDIRRGRAFICYERIAGPGGLPTGSAGGVLTLLSGGFDSPVASFEMMRRGCNVDYITFHSSPYTPPETVSKVASLARQLNRYQKRGRLVSVNLLPLQKAVRDCCQEKFRTVLYRRFMVRVAAIVAQYFGDLALVTGDNLGQVASQTLANLAVVEDACPLMILRPLLTFDKLDIMAVARRIGTFDLSLPEVPDSCTVFAPRTPATNAPLKLVQAEEAKLPVRELLQQVLEGTVLLNADTLSSHAFPELLQLLPPAEGEG